MKRKKRLLSSLCVGLLLGSVACSKKEIVFEECNDIFTEGYFEEIQEIIYWNGDTQYVIESKEKREFFALFSALTLTEKPTPRLDELLAGGISIEFVTEDDSKRVAVLSGEIRMNGTFYDVDKNILDELREIVFGEDE